MKKLFLVAFLFANQTVMAETRQSDDVLVDVYQLQLTAMYPEHKAGLQYAFVNSRIATTAKAKAIIQLVDNGDPVAITSLFYSGIVASAKDKQGVMAAISNMKTPVEEQAQKIKQITNR